MQILCHRNRSPPARRHKNSNLLYLRGKPGIKLLEGDLFHANPVSCPLSHRKNRVNTRKYCAIFYFPSHSLKSPTRSRLTMALSSFSCKEMTFSLLLKYDPVFWMALMLIMTALYPTLMARCTMIRFLGNADMVVGCEFTQVFNLNSRVWFLNSTSVNPFPLPREVASLQRIESWREK